MFRAFGSPFTVNLHQNVTYLRLKQVPFKVYCTNFFTTSLYAKFYRARNGFCCLTPSGNSYMQVWQLFEHGELDANLNAVKEKKVGEVDFGDLKPQKMLVDKKTHPQLNVACWAIVVYSCWWLAKEGMLYRWVMSEKNDVICGYLQYFLLFSHLFPVKGFSVILREQMKKMLVPQGVSRSTAVFLDEHFSKLCVALDSHFQQHPEFRFILGTPHPTLADVTLCAAFSGFFVMSDPPSTRITERHPHLLQYVERITGWQGDQFVNDTAPGGPAEESEASYPDEVPESLSDLLALIAEVSLFLMSQCASFTAYMSSDAIRTLKKDRLREGEWSGCEAYLFPQITKILSLMIIDQNVYTVVSRAQDLEIALLGAREVVDDTLDSMGRLHDDEESVDTSRYSVFTAKGEEEKTESASEVVEVEDEEVEERLAPPPQERRLVDSSLWGRAQGSTTGEEPVLQADDADFYRAYTKDGLRGYSTVSLGQSLATRQRHDTAVANGGRGELVAKPPVKKYLNLLTGFFHQMHCPQYTLSTVQHGRLLYVAVLPEFEVAKVRKKRTVHPKEEA
ncbi:hypothetical protein AGDE_09675 [Angomonas deanei]|nr:hypothetical protein AGDE_09675 [Angomonas deanei]|eukprot:EPY29976.1 hypothetical protein AGDE_09675 [Angomonas deanei]